MARILIVDDSLVMRRNLEYILKYAGHTVVGQAVNGKQAIIMYSELEPDIVTMDISMPVMSGVEAVEQIINMDKKARIIMVSALSQKQNVFEAIQKGALHYITKPIDHDNLLATINEVLNENFVGKVDSSQLSHTIPGFKIENANGKFVVYFNSNIGLKDFSGLDTAIKGLLFVKPLHIIFDFGNIENIDDEVLQPILKLAKIVQESDGFVEHRTASLILQRRLIY